MTINHSTYNSAPIPLPPVLGRITPQGLVINYAFRLDWIHAVTTVIGQKKLQELAQLLQGLPVFALNLAKLGSDSILISAIRQNWAEGVKHLLCIGFAGSPSALYTAISSSDPTIIYDLLQRATYLDETVLETAHEEAILINRFHLLPLLHNPDESTLQYALLSELDSQEDLTTTPTTQKVPCFFTFSEEDIRKSANGSLKLSKARP